MLIDVLLDEHITPTPGFYLHIAHLGDASNIEGFRVSGRLKGEGLVLGVKSSDTVGCFQPCSTVPKPTNLTTASCTHKHTPQPCTFTLPSKPGCQEAPASVC